jgi:hypothetical protein
MQLLDANNAQDVLSPFDASLDHGRPRTQDSHRPAWYGAEIWCHEHWLNRKCHTGED